MPNEGIGLEKGAGLFGRTLDHCFWSSDSVLVRAPRMVAGRARMFHHAVTRSGVSGLIPLPVHRSIRVVPLACPG